MKFLLDANFLVYAAKQKVDLLVELSRFGKPELHTLNAVVEEVEGLAKGKGEDGAAARVALDFVGRKVKVISAEPSRETDEMLLEHANAYVICTNDRALRDQVKWAGGKVVCVRQKRLLMML